MRRGHRVARAAPARARIGLLGRSLVVVEEIGTARREAGDVILAAAQGALDWGDVHTLQEVVLGTVERATDRPNVFKSVGMAWQDLVIAEHVGRP